MATLSPRYGLGATPLRIALSRLEKASLAARVTFEMVLSADVMEIGTLDRDTVSATAALQRHSDMTHDLFRHHLGNSHPTH